MPTPPLQLLWFKRDLRVLDHAPLFQAAKAGPVLALYVYEPEVLHAPDYAPQHLGFTNECLSSLQSQLQALGISLVLRHGEITEVLHQLHQESGFAQLWSHEETGNLITYRRDQRVARWCSAHEVPWQELPSNGVVRRLQNRDHWSRLWHQRMHAAPLPAPSQASTWPHIPPSQGLMDAATLQVHGEDKPLRQRGGHAKADQLLKSFLDSRATDYRYGMSSPLTAQDVCSRLSPYLAYGVLSVRMVVHALHRARDEWQAMPVEHRPRGMLHSLSSFESRLHWHCHFIQKLESQPDIEWRDLHPAYEGLRTAPQEDKFQAWCEGRTGVPMVDACMRMLLATGWINFRMRAMLMSFSSYHLWQDWREPALHLARHFLDYEPGIHYPQVQMQSGTTGINTIRIYSPIKQALDQDPDGAFIRQWCPELAKVPTAYLAEPWTMPITLQQHLGVVIGRDYPAPVVDVTQAGRYAREQMWAMRTEQKKQTVFRETTRHILQQHASRDPQRNKPRDVPLDPPLKRAQNKKGHRAASAVNTVASPQFDLFHSDGHHDGRDPGLNEGHAHG